MSFNKPTYCFEFRFVHKFQQFYFIKQGLKEFLSIVDGLCENVWKSGRSFTLLRESDWLEHDAKDKDGFVLLPGKSKK